MYQFLAIETQADATHCFIIVLMLVQFSLEERGVIAVKMRGATPPNISTALNFLKMCVDI